MLFRCISHAYVVCVLITPAVLGTNEAAPQGAHVAPGTAVIAGQLVNRATQVLVAGEVAAAVRTSDGRVVLTHVQAAAGVFEIQTAPGTVYLTTKAEGFATEHAAIDVVAGESRFIQLPLLQGRLLRGIVTEPDGHPIPDAIVSVSYPRNLTDSSSLAATYEWEQGRSRTDAAGRFELRDVHLVNSFIVEAEHPGYVTGVSAMQAATLSADPGDVRIVLGRGATLQGRVLDQTGQPVADASVRLLEMNDNTDLRAFAFAKTTQQRIQRTAAAADGSFRFESVRPGQWQMDVSRSGYDLWRDTVTLPTSQPPMLVVLQRKR